MRYLFLILITMACNPFKQVEPKVGECVIGPTMEVFKLMSTENKTYTFAKYPVVEGSTVLALDDPSALKIVQCPK